MNAFEYCLILTLFIVVPILISNIRRKPDYDRPRWKL